ACQPNDAARGEENTPLHFGRSGYSLSCERKFGLNFSCNVTIKALIMSQSRRTPRSGGELESAPLAGPLAIRCLLHGAGPPRSAASCHHRNERGRLAGSP